ncbi:SPOR domain-containing protein [Sulfitobacter sp. S190]|uniref:SPOR domain-containing protein n=1 Tax=Sulfitobacter sp. S190 TaxID=2867022 RepID=UPI0021A26995|nr:SPOR domain-containing protein [Sulfitobacter sp. S190]UWR23800.1 SPOR domain-containing protein [Sulfitobacter sp. S190]
MADFTHVPETGGAQGFYHSGAEPVSRTATLGKLTNMAGAAVSLALIAGVCVWGYKLMVRDVSGIPVVRAIEGDMRVRPLDPGGQLAQHQGLSVNAVAAVADGRPADTVRLAPQPTDLAEEDQPMPALQVADAPEVVDPLSQGAPLGEAIAVSADAPAPTSAEITAALQSGEVQDLVAQLTDGVAPLAALDTAPATVAAPSTDAQEIPTITAPVDAAGVVQISLRPPVARPTRPTEAPQTATPAAASASAGSTDLDPASLPAGTRLVQLGAFDSADIAREQWARLNGKFGPYLEGKSRIIQKATSGGRTFYRLRAHGFSDIADARRFCSALVAESADCIPVVTR